MKRRVYEVLNAQRPSDRVSRVVTMALLLLIAANVAASVLETDADIAARASSFFVWFERISVCVFALEYLLRIWSCTTDFRFARPIAGRLRYMVSPLAIIDLASIAPSLVNIVVPGALDLRFLRVLRLLRLFRLLRFGRPAEAFGTLTRVIAAKGAELGVTLVVVLIAMLLSAGLMYVVESGHPGTHFTSMPHAMWWAIVTITTVGYGDLTPVTPIGQAIGGLVAFVGICALALPVGILSSGYIDEINRRKKARAPHGSCPTCGQALEHPAPHQGLD